MSKKLNNKRLEALFDNIPIPKSDPFSKEQTNRPHVLLNIPVDEACPVPPDAQTIRLQESIDPYCPHIGLLYDPQTCFSYPSEGNLCHSASPVNAPNYEHQRIFCLTVSYKTCPFLCGKAHTPLPEYIRLLGIKSTP